MKCILNISLFLLSSFTISIGQNVGIGTVNPNAKLQVKPDSANAVQIDAYGASAGETGELRFKSLNGGYVGLKAADTVNSNSIWTLPAADGDSARILATDGKGNLFWKTDDVGGNGSGAGQGGVITAKPFINRRSSASTTSSSWTNLITVSPLDSSKFLTITNLILEGKRSSCCCAYLRFRFTYADGSSYVSDDYGCPGTSWTTQADVSVPVFSTSSGTISKIEVEGYTNSGGTLSARFTLSGYESDSSAVSVKPFINRRSTKSTTATSWTTLDTILPLVSGNHIALTNVLLEGKRSSCCCAYLRFKVFYSDGTSYISSDYGCPGTSWTIQANTEMPVYSNIKSTITKIEIQGYTNAGGTLSSKFSVSGYENIP